MRASGSIRPAASVPEHWRQQLRLSEKSTHTERTAFAFGIGAASPASRGPLPVFLTLAVLVAALAFLVAPAAGQSVAHIKPVFERSKVNVLEGGSVRVGIKLNANPGRDVTVRIARRSADNSVTLASGRYTISRATWNIFRLGGLVQEITLNGPAKRGGFQYRPTNYLYFSVDGSELETRLVAEVIDTDERRRPAGVVVSKPRLMINNFPPGLGSASGTYAVKLASRPHQNVEVKPFAASGTPLSFSPWDGLEFTPDNWNQWQEFEVKFTAQDVDREHDSYEVCHWTTSSSITGGDPHYHDQGLESYLIAITGGRMEGGLGCFTAVEIDQDAPGIVMDPNPWDFGWRFDLAEGMSRNFDVRPRTQPSADVTITPVRRPPSDLHPGDATITANSLTFTNMNWDTPQTLTFTAAEDDDDWAYTRAQRFHLTTTSSDPDYANKRFITIDVRAVENDESPGVKVADQNQEWISDPTREERGYVSLPVGQTSTIYMRLTQRPLSRPVTIHPKIGYYYNAENGSNRITILNDSLTFTTSNWNTYQPVRVRANAGSLGVSGEIWIFFSSADDRYDAHAYNTMRFRVVAASVSVGGNSGTEAPEPEAPQPVAGQVGEPEPEAGGQGGGSEPDPEVGGQGGAGETDLVEPVEPPDPEIAAPGEERGAGRGARPRRCRRAGSSRRRLPQDHRRRDGHLPDRSGRTSNAQCLRRCREGLRPAAPVGVPGRPDLHPGQLGSATAGCGFVSAGRRQHGRQRSILPHRLQRRRIL